jgi:hypothetical protein
VNGLLDVVSSPLKHQLKHSTALFFLHELGQKRLDFVEVEVGLVRSVLLRNFHHVLDGGQLMD